jgi:hypothetical protein
MGSFVVEILNAPRLHIGMRGCLRKSAHRGKSHPCLAASGSLRVQVRKPSRENPRLATMPRRVTVLPQEKPGDVCARPLSGSANRAQNVNARRAQVRRETEQAVLLAVRTGNSIGAAYLFQVGRNAARLTPGGTWIRGGTSKEDGNILFGAVTDQLGIPLGGVLAFGDLDEIIHDTFGLLGLADYDGHFGPDSQIAKDQITVGATCPG